MNLWLDDERKPWLHRPDRVWAWAKTAAEAIELLKTGQVAYASLDHDLGLCDACAAANTHEGIVHVRAGLVRLPGFTSYCSCKHNGTGYDVVLWMEEHGVWPSEGAVVHSMNTAGRARMEAAIDRHYR